MADSAYCAFLCHYAQIVGRVLYAVLRCTQLVADGGNLIDGILDGLDRFSCIIALEHQCTR